MVIVQTLTDWILGPQTTMVVKNPYMTNSRGNSGKPPLICVFRRSGVIGIFLLRTWINGVSNLSSAMLREEPQFEDAEGIHLRIVVPCDSKTLWNQSASVSLRSCSRINLTEKAGWGSASHCQANGISAFSIHEYWRMIEEWLRPGWTISPSPSVNRVNQVFGGYSTPPFSLEADVAALWTWHHGGQAWSMESLGTGHGGHGGDVLGLWAQKFKFENAVLKLRVDLVTSFSPDGKRRHNKVATDLLNSICSKSKYIDHHIDLGSIWFYMVHHGSIF